MSDDVKNTTNVVDSTTNPIWDLHIIRAENGFILTDQDGRDTVIEDDEEDDLKSRENLLWYVMDHFSLGGSRYDKERLKVIRAPGDKYER